MFGNEEVSLRDALREGASDSEIVSLVNAALKKKAWKHAGNKLIKLTTAISDLRKISFSLSLLIIILFLNNSIFHLYKNVKTEQIFNYVIINSGMENLAKMKNRPMILIGG